MAEDTPLWQVIAAGIFLALAGYITIGVAAGDFPPETLDVVPDLIEAAGGLLEWVVPAPIA